MDTSQYKDCVLVLLFVEYVSDKYARVADLSAKAAAHLKMMGFRS